MRVGVVGINHKLADLKLREKLAKTCQRRFGPSESTHAVHNFVLLSTCNRTEVYFSSEDLANSHSHLLSILRYDVDEDFDQKLYSYFGHDCFIHLCRVTAGLDSAIIAETEIQGQVKAAYEAVLEFHRLPFDLHYLFQKSLTIGKKIRSNLPLKPGLPDIEHAIFSTGTDLFKNIKDTKVLFIGASEINEKILGYLRNKKMENITLCNRSLENAQNLAEKFQINIMGWEKFPLWHQYEWIIFGTKAPDHLIKSNDILNMHISPKLIIDLSVPRNVEPKVGNHPNITLLNIDQLNRTLKIRKKHMNKSLTKAEELVADSTAQYIRLFNEKEKNRLRLIA